MIIMKMSSRCLDCQPTVRYRPSCAPHTHSQLVLGCRECSMATTRWGPGTGNRAGQQEDRRRLRTFVMKCNHTWPSLLSTDVDPDIIYSASPRSLIHANSSGIIQGNNTHQPASGQKYHADIFQWASPGFLIFPNIQTILYQSIGGNWEFHKNIPTRTERIRTTQVLAMVVTVDRLDITICE